MSDRDEAETDSEAEPAALPDETRTGEAPPSDTFPGAMPPETMPPGAMLPSASPIDRYLGFLLLGSALLLVLGWVLPVMTVETLFIFADEVSILQACYRLLENGDVLLFAVIALFTIVFPVVKLVLAYLAWTQMHRADPRLIAAVHWIEAIGKWSMLDVFVVALVLVVIKMSVVSDVAIEPGLYIFIVAVVSSMLIVKRICWLARQAGGPSETA